MKWGISMWLKFFFSFLLVWGFGAAAADMRGVQSGTLPDGIKGTFAYIDPAASKLIEVDSTGKVLWDWDIPRLGGYLFEGADVEWIASSGSFLFVIPGSGVYEVSKRDRRLTWSCKTKFISHDADRLPNGDTIFVNAWDADDDPIVTVVDSACVEKKKLYAKQLGLNPEKRRNVSGESYSNTHINAIQVIDDGSWLLSLRNYNQIILFSTEKGVLKKWGKATRVHDPLWVGDGTLLHAKRNQNELVLIGADKSRRSLFASQDGDWAPLRTIQLIDKKYLLITGSQSVGIVDYDGKIHWSLKLAGFQPQRSRQPGAPFLYKAVFIPSASN